MTNLSQRPLDPPGDFMQQTFSLAGVTKCGTSSLFAYLEQHPDICLSTPKEPWCLHDPEAFRLYRASNFSRYYAEHFPHYAGQSAVGDFNPRKLTFPWALRHLHELMPGGRLLILLRNPIDRAFSEWWMDYCADSETLSFENALKENLACIQHGEVLHDDEATALRIFAEWYRTRQMRQPMPTRTYLGSGYYWKGVERAYELFGPQNVQLILLEDLRKEPAPVLHKVFTFLGVRSDLAVNSRQHHNVAQGELARQAISLARKTGLPRLIPHALKEKLTTSVGQATHLVGDSRPRLQDETRQWLLDHFAEHNRRLSQLTGHDLSAWDS